jgi:sterol desaturase/sphingolipid hydroxylase (fatty acid hydroxylase superfamily)
MSMKILSPVLIILAAGVLISLERRYPYDAKQRLFREGFWTDLIGYALIQSYLLGLVISTIIGWLAARGSVPSTLLVWGWPVWAQLGFFLVVHDFYIYWFHRLQHHSDVLWRTHEAHHSVDDVDWLSGSRSHSLEILINQTIEFAPMVLLGASGEVVLMKATLDAVWGMYIHSNVDVRSGWLQHFINGPEMHRWHHARELPAPGKNFSTKLAVWDWVFGTAHRPPAKPLGYGSDDPHYPRAGFWAWLLQHGYAFRRPRVSGLAELQRPPATP